MNQVEIQLFVMNSNFNSMISSKILNTSLLVSFEPEETVKFDAISLKLLTVIIYIIEILASAILMTFVVYETRGLAGHYRTVINQIFSCGYGAVRAPSFLIFYLNFYLHTYYSVWG